MEQSSSGTFAAQGREDILVVAIGRPEPLERVRGTGRGISIRSFFGNLAQHVTLSQLSEADKKLLKGEFKKDPFSKIQLIAPNVTYLSHHYLIMI